MEGQEENVFASFKKVIIFGVEGSGKSTLSKSLETGKFSEQSHTNEGKYIFIIFSHFEFIYS